MQVSNTFREVLKIGPEFHTWADMQLSNGKTVNLKESDFMSGSFQITGSTSASGKLEVGAVTAQQFKVNLNNFNGDFTDSELEGAVITPYVGLVTRMDWRGYTMEKIKRGRFTVNDPKSVGTVVQLTALDNMSKFDQAYTKSALSYPATLGQIVADACTCCGVTLATLTFTNSSYTVTTRPSDGALTFRDIISYAAQLGGCFARCNAEGSLELSWYDFSRFSLPETDENRPWSLSGITSSDIRKADIVVTGVQIIGNDSAKTVYKSGTDGFMISVSNPLAQEGLQALVDTLGNKLIRMTFRPFTASANENPAIEAGDVCYITDTDRNTYRSIVSNLDYKTYQNESYSGDAETVSENSTVYYSPSQKAQNSADNAQQAADTAQQGVSEAKTEISQLNGQILLKVSKDSIISAINLSPEGITIDASKLDIKAYVTFSALEDSGSTVINGGNITTGKIKSENGDYWVDLTSGEVYMKNGTFAGQIVWSDSNGVEVGSIKSDGVRTMTLFSDTLNVNVFHANFEQDIFVPILTCNSLTCGSINTDGESGLTTQVGITRSDGSKRTLQFTNGLLTDSNA
jgi:hypothetical protein